jgi:serine/threonine protein kinase/ActR/RegA family two-component response regulator/tetratricopeptide (TPR) repeat protein
LNPINILVVDDDKDFQNLIVTALQDEGFRTTSALNGREALDMIQTEKPLFMILDLLMPEMSGEELCRIIKENPLLRDIIIFVLSANDDLETKVSCLEIGANEFLVKPIHPREISVRIKRFMRMIDEFRNAPPVAPNVPAVDRPIFVPTTLDKDKSHGTIDVGLQSADSFARIKAKYGIYKIETLIGSGGMGYVFKAFDEPLDRFVAIKILSKRLSGSAQFIERFRREAKILASIDHPGIAHIFSFGEEEGECYFAMQWCPGGSLADLIRKKGRIELLPSLDIILQCAQALEAASKKGIVHRDIKPNNLLFDENQHIQIVDFGLASGEQMSSRVTQVQEFLGTPSFMAPEQAQSSAVDHRADIYALGITMYFMLYGTHPFEANSAIEMVIKHASEPFPQHNDLGGRIPKAAYEIIQKMTEKNPAERYQDYKALIDDVDWLRKQLLSMSQWKIPRAEKQSPTPVLKGASLFELLSVLFNQSVSGVLTVRWAQLHKKFFIRHREIILFQSSQPDENIWSVLVQKHGLPKDQMPPPDEDLETSLNRLLLEKTITIEDFKTAYRKVMKAALMQVFFWPVFEGEFYSANIEHDAFASMRIADLLLEAARSLINPDQIPERFQSDLYVARTPQFDVILSSLDIRPDESFLASRLDAEPITLKTLQLLTGQTEEKINRFVYALMKLGAVQLRTAEERRASRRVDVAPTTPAIGYDSKPVKEIFKTEKPKVIEPVTSASITTPAPAPAVAKSDQRTLSDESFVRMEQQKSEGKLEQEHNVKVAEQIYRLAQEKLAELDYWKVTQLCRQAIKNNPSESKYYHLMALAYASHPRFGKDAEQCFYKAIEVDPWNPEYHIDLARFYIQQGLPNRALSQCESALKLSPQHAKALELLSELSFQK